jgi:hypothetical protein
VKLNTRGKIAGARQQQAPHHERNELDVSAGSGEEESEVFFEL